MTLADKRNMVDASGWYIFSTDISGNRWNDFQESWGIVFSIIESNIYNISSSGPVDISTNKIANDTWNAYDISTNPIIDPFTPYWAHVLTTGYGMTRIVQSDNTGNQTTKYIDVRGIIGYDSYVNGVDIENIISITVGNIVDTISHDTFANISNLQNVNISKNVTHIQSNAFQNCSGLTTIVFQDGASLTSIDSTAFTGCTSLTDVYMTQDTLTSIGTISFANNQSFFGATTVSIKQLYMLTKYTV
jgi:hypothetical protein